MKRVIFYLAAILFLASCEQNRIIPDDEIPVWLEERIARDEAIIRSDPHSGLDIAAWIRYTYEEQYFYEYVNLLSSGWPKVYTFRGTESIMDGAAYIQYSKDKCCKKYIWKGPSYIEL